MDRLSARGLFQPDNGPELAAGSLREMHNPRYIADNQWTQAQGISWSATRQDDAIWIRHSGGIPGFTSTICFDPAPAVGAIVLLNGTGTSVPLAFRLAAIARRVVLARPPRIFLPEPVPERYRPLLGLYTQTGWGGWLMRLEWRDGNLTFARPEWPTWQQVLLPDGEPDRFAVAPGCDQAGESAVFRRSPDGRVLSAFIASTTWTRLDSAPASSLGEPATR